MSPETTQPRTGYLPTLDGWRAVAVLLVIAFHGLGDQTPSWARGFPFGFLGVDIFFALSGFLICTRLLGEQRQSGGISLAGFYIRRSFRILPAAWVYLTALVALSALGLLSVTRSELVGCVLFCRNYYPSGQHWYTVHFWSLAVEEHFYLLFPALLAVLGRKSGHVRWAILSLSVLVALVRSFDSTILSLAGGLLPPGTFFWTRTHVRIDALLWGCFAALAVERHRTWMTRWVSAPGVTLCLLAAAVGGFFLPLSLTWRAFLLPWMVVGTVLRPHTWLARVLEWHPLRRIGRLSYSLYLWQQLFCVGEAVHRSAGLTAVQTWPGNVVALLCVASVSYYFIERPMIGWGHRLASPAMPGRV